MPNLNQPLTPIGVARISMRGIRANFAPDNQKAETEKLVELFHDMAMARDADGETGADRLAAGDAIWLDAIASELESFVP
jgi:hypothetical protein